MAKKMNAYEIIKSQLITGREVCKSETLTGATVTVSLPGSPQAQVIRVEDEGKKFILEEIVEEGKSPREFILTKETAPAYHYVGNRNPKAVSDATLEDGVLTVDGKEVFLGTLEPTEILACVKGFVLLLFPSPEDDDSFVVGAYDVQKDVFNTCLDGLCGEYDEYEDEYITPSFNCYLAATNVRGETFILAQRLEEVQAKDDDGNDISYEICTKPTMFTVSESMGSEPRLSLYTDLDTKGLVNSFELVDDGTREAIVVRFNRAMEDGKLDDVGIMAEVFYGSSVMRYLTGDVEVFMGGAQNSYPVITAKTSKEMQIMYCGNTTTVATPNDEMAGFNYFAGYSQRMNEDDQLERTYTYANASQEVKSFTMTDTDRGVIIDFE